MMEIGTLSNDLDATSSPLASQVRYGSQADICAESSDVRFVPKADMRMACRMSLSTLLFLNRLLPHLPQVMLCMLVEVLDFDRITGGSGISRKRHIVFILPFGICSGVGIRLGLARLR